MKKKLTRAESQALALKRHEVFLKSVGFKGTAKGFRPVKKAFEDPLPTRRVAPTSDSMEHVNSAPKTKPEGAKEFTVAPAFNKGGYQLVTPSNIKDIGRA